MRRIVLRSALIVAALLMAWAGSAAAEEEGPDGLTASALSEFLAKLQGAVAADDPAQVAPLMRFPLRVGGVPRVKGTVKANQFRALYPSIFTPEVKQALQSQKASELFRNYQGAMVGNGQIWISGICSDQACSHPQIRVITVNVPPSKH